MRGALRRRAARTVQRAELHCACGKAKPSIRRATHLGNEAAPVHARRRQQDVAWFEVLRAVGRREHAWGEHAWVPMCGRLLRWSAHTHAQCRNTWDNTD